MGDSVLMRTRHGVHSFLSQPSDRRREFLVSQCSLLVHLLKRAFILGASSHLAVDPFAGAQHLHDVGGCEPGVIMHGESSPRCTPKNPEDFSLTLIFELP